MKKKSILTLILAVLSVATAFAQQDAWNTVYKEIDSRIKAPTFKQKTYVAAVKAKNAAKKNQQIINQTIAKCSKDGGGTVVIRAGKYMTGPITLQSNVNLRVEAGICL